MGRFYKTHSAPIVDYSYKYPFTELFQATKYKNELQDGRMDKINQAYDDVLGLNFIPGTEVNGVYQPSPSELYVKQKRSQIDELVDNYANTDLTTNVWGNINRDITKLTNDPNLADIQTSYNNYQKNIAHQRQLDKLGQLDENNRWGASGDPAQQMWDVENMGIYPFQPSAAYHDPAALYEKYYKDMNVDEAIDPITGLIKKDITKEDIRRVAGGTAEAFVNTPEGQDAIATYKRLNPTTSMTDLEIAEDAIFKYGQKYLGSDLSGSVSKGPKKNDNISLVEQESAGRLRGTDWALKNETTTANDIMDKIATNLGPGIYDIQSGVNVYINPVDTDRVGTMDDLVISHNIGVYKNFINEHGNLQSQVIAEQSAYEDIDIDKLNKTLESSRTSLSAIDKRETSTLNNKVKIIDRKILNAETRLERAKENLENGIDKGHSEYNLNTHRTNIEKQQELINEYTTEKQTLVDAGTISSPYDLKQKEKYKQIIADAEAQIELANSPREVTEFQKELDAAILSYADNFGVDVTDPELVALAKNYKSSIQDLEDLDLSKEDMKELLSLELSSMASGGAAWQHVDNATTKTIVIGKTPDGLPITAKFIQGNLILTEGQMQKYFTDRGYDDDWDWYDSNYWGESFVGPDSKYNLVTEYRPPAGSKLDEEQVYYKINGAWRQAPDTWDVANSINVYTTGKGRSDEMLEQEKLYTQGRGMQMTDAMFGHAMTQNLMHNWLNSKKLFAPNIPGLVNQRETIATNINEFIKDSYESGESDRIDEAKRLEKYLVEEGLWEGDYTTNNTYNTGKFIDQDYYSSGDVPNEYKYQPYLYDGNQSAMKAGEFVDLFKNSIGTDTDLRKAITNKISMYEGDGIYNGVTYIDDGKFIDTPAAITAYKGVARTRANALGLNEITISSFSNLNDSGKIYAPYLSNGAKVTLNNLNTIANVLKVDLKINGLYRTKEYNNTLSGSDPNSRHITGDAIDVGKNSEFMKWLEGNPNVQKHDGKYYVTYNGQVMFTVLEESDHLHIEHQK